MTDLIFGLFFILISCLLCLFSWKCLTIKKYPVSIFLLLFFGFILRLFVASDGFLHDWDEQFHALVAKNLLSHLLLPTLYDQPILDFDYTNWGSNHIWLHKQPVALWGMAFGIKLFGLNEWAIRMPTVCISTLSILFTYLIGRSLFDRKTAWIAAFLHAINGYIIELTGGRVTTDHIDIYFFFFIEFAILLSLLSSQNPHKRWLDVLIGLTIGLAILTKWLPALIVLPVYILFHANCKTEFIRICTGVFTIVVVCLVVFLPWQIYIHTSFPLEAQWESNYNWLHITKALEGHAAPFYYHFVNLQIIFGELIYVPLIVFFYYTIRKRKLKYAALSVWILIPLLFFTLVATKMKAYILFIGPALFLITALIIRFLIFHKKKFKHQWLVRVVIALLFLLPVRFSIERIKPFSPQFYTPQWTKDLKELAQKVDDENGVIFNVKHPIKAMFYGNFTAYQLIPSKSQIEKLLQHKHAIYLYNLSPAEKEKFTTVTGVVFLE